MIHVGCVVIANFFYFAHAPILPLLATKLGVDARLAALLVASQKAGLFLSSAFGSASLTRPHLTRWRVLVL